MTEREKLPLWQGPKPTNEQMDSMYEQFGKPLEEERRGEFVAVSRYGDVFIGKTLLETMRGAEELYGKPNCIFNIGEKNVAKMRSPRQKIT